MAQDKFETHSTMQRNSAIKKSSNFRLSATGTSYQQRDTMWCTSPVGSHPENSTPEGIMDMCAYIIGEWCCTKYVANPSIQQVTNKESDLTDLLSDRVVRGYYHRRNSRRLLPFPFGETGYHLGCGWTRMHFHPIEAVRHAARHGFRVVEEIADKEVVQR